MKTTTLAICILCLAAPLQADTETDAEAGEAPANQAIAILEQADAAVKAVDSVRFEASVEATGVAANFAPNASGKGFMSGWSGSGPEKFYARVETRPAGDEAPAVYEGGGDGESYFLIDHATRKAYEDMDPMVMGTNGQVIQGLGMPEFVHPAPFDDELAAEVVELQGSEKVGDEDCYKIHVVYTGGRGESTWFFSKQDHLPRARIQHFTIPNQGEGTIAVKLSKLEVDVEPEAGMFRLKLPEGYEQIDDFAP
jgi:hypothetical protein